MSPNTTPSAHSARAARLVPWPGLSASGVRVLDRCDSVTSVVVAATTERSFPSQSPIRIVNRHGAAVVLVGASWVDSSNPPNARIKHTRAGLSVAIRVHSISSVSMRVAASSRKN
jgi:hypothetical protein